MLDENSGLYRKYRPKDFDEVIGNEAVISSLKSLLSRDKKKIPHVFMFIGEFGCGKTSFGRILASKLGCSDFDLSEMDIGTDRSVDDADFLKEKIKYAPMKGKCRVIILDELQMASAKFQGSLLKTLEDDCPNHVYFIICTTDPQKINGGIKTRASKYIVKPLEFDQQMALLTRVTKEEKANIPKGVLELIAEASGGSKREALVLLDQIISLKSEEEMKQIIKASTQKEEVINLCRALINGKSWKEVVEIVDGLDADAESIRHAIRGYCVSIVKKGGKSAAVTMARVILKMTEQTYFYNGKSGLWQHLDEIVNG